MSKLSVAFSVVAPIAIATVACSSNPGVPGTPVEPPSSPQGSVYTVLVEGTLKPGVRHGESMYDAFATAVRSTAQGEGDLVRDVFLNKDPIPTGTASLMIDRWGSLSAFDSYEAQVQAKQFIRNFYASPPDVSVYETAPGFTTWGSPADLAPGKSNYAITIRGHFQGDVSQAQATHNGIVAHVPPPGAQGLGNSAHMVFHDASDQTQMLILEVWTSEPNQEAAYKALAPEIENLWAGMPAVTRWNTTDWTRW